MQLSPLGVHCTLWHKQGKRKKAWGKEWGGRRNVGLFFAQLFCLLRGEIGLLIKENHHCSHGLPKCQPGQWLPDGTIMYPCLVEICIFKYLRVSQCFCRVLWERRAFHSHPLLGWNEKVMGGSTWWGNFKNWEVSVLLCTDLMHWLFRNSCGWRRRRLFSL